MIAPIEAFEPKSSDPLPNSKKAYVSGVLHSDVRVPMREISLSDTKRMDGTIEENKSVCVYDASGPWGDEAFDGDVENGLPALRASWIQSRADVEEYVGREIKPQDNGYLTRVHADYASNAERNRLVEFPGLRRKPLRASAGHPVTQLWYARQGVITPEMEFIAIRENMYRSQISEQKEDIVRNNLDKQHAGSTQLPDSCLLYTSDAADE